jgi:perosamine synthetase
LSDRAPRPDQPHAAPALRIPLSRPEIDDADRQAVLDVLSSGRLSLGPRLEEFEGALARRSGVAHAVATSSGTAALHLAVRAIGLQPGDEVITTPFSFVASANCLLFEGARPVFVDVQPDTLNIDPTHVRRAISARTRAILGVDVFGHPADWDELRALADEFGLRLIEDSAEALGSRYRGRAAGGLGDCGVFGFYPNKQITTGEGGALVTDDSALAELCASLRNHGREADGDEWMEHKRLGYNYRLSEVACALGLAQLARLDDTMRRRARVAAWYDARLARHKTLRRPLVRDDVQLSWFVYVVRLADDLTRADRDRIIAALHARGVGCRNYFPPIHLQPFYRERFGYRPGEFPVAEAAAERTIALPFFTTLSEAEVAEVVAALEEVV